MPPINRLAAFVLWQGIRIYLTKLVAPMAGRYSNLPIVDFSEIEKKVGVSITRLSDLLI